MDISARSLHIKREVITKLLNEGLYPYTKRYLGSFDNHFSTIGLVGMNEAGLNAKWLGCDMSDPRTQKFTKEVLTHMRNRLSDYQEEYPGELFNLEATPAESTAYRLAKHDRKRWPYIRTAGSKGDTPYYTNSSHLPVEYSSDIFDALDIQDELHLLCHAAVWTGVGCKQIFMCFYRLDLDIIICHCNHTGMDFLKFGVKHIIQCTVLVLLRFSIIPVLYRTVISGNSTVNLCFLSTFRTGKVLTT